MLVEQVLEIIFTLLTVKVDPEPEDDPLPLVLEPLLGLDEPLLPMLPEADPLLSLLPIMRT